MSVVSCQLSVVSCQSNESLPEIVLNNLPEDKMNFQKMMIGQLTGETNIKTKDGVDIVINSRWEPKEKRLEDAL